MPCSAKQGALGSRQIHGEGGSLSRGAVDGDPPAVVLGHMPYYGEAHPRSAGSLGASLVHPVETLEDAWDLPLGDADACVRNADRYLRLVGAPDHLDPAPGGVYFTALSTRLVNIEVS